MGRIDVTDAVHDHAVKPVFEILLELKAEAREEVARKASQCVHILCPLGAR